MAPNTQQDLDPAERPHNNPKRALSFYLVALFTVVPVWSLTPISWAFVLYTIISGNLLRASWPSKAWFFVAFCEVGQGAPFSVSAPVADLYDRQVLFSLYYYYLTTRIIGRAPLCHGSIRLQLLAFKRVLRAGTASFPGSPAFDEETLDSERPGSPDEDIVQLDADDPRAIDFRNSFRNWHGLSCLTYISLLTMTPQVWQGPFLVHPRASCAHLALCLCL